MSRTSLDALLEEIRKYVYGAVPGAVPRLLRIDLGEHGRIEHPIPPALRILPRAEQGFEEEEEDERPFKPTEFQADILRALSGKAMRADVLGEEVGGRRELYRPRGVQELVRRGLVKKCDDGYYRPDAPPEPGP